MKKVMRKSLSVFLSILMVLTSCVIGVTGITAVATDVEAKSGVTSTDLVKFIVPEQIYLMPDLSSWRQNSSTSFQYYVNNDVNNTPLAEDAQTTGKIYTTIPDDATDVTLTATALSYNKTTGEFAAMTGGSVTVGTPAAGEDVETDITGGTSPTLARESDGYYLLWELAYNDANGAKALYNVSYVYKPYTVPVGAVSGLQSPSVENDGNHETALVLSGFNSLKTDEAHASADNKKNMTVRHGAANYTGYNESNTNQGFAIFPTADGVARGSTVTTDLYAPGQTLTKAPTIGSFGNRSLPFFNYNSGNAWAIGNTYNINDECFVFWNDHDGGYWGPQTNGTTLKPYKDYKSSSDGTLLDNFIMSRYNGSYTATGDGGLRHYHYQASVNARPYMVGVLNLDSSRYTNLNQVPNLSVTLINNNASKANDYGGAFWYVSDITQLASANDSQVLDNDYYANSIENSYNKKGTIFAGTDIGWSDFNSSVNDDQDGINNRGFDPNLVYEAVPYCGSIDRALDYSNYSDYYVRGFIGDRSRRGTGSSKYRMCYFYTATVGMHVNSDDKSELRSTVQNAISLMGRLGVNDITADGLISSRYFDRANLQSGFGAFATDLRDAFTALTTLDMTQTKSLTASAANSALSTAMTQLYTTCTFDKGDGEFADNAFAEHPTFNGTIDSETFTTPHMTAPEGYEFDYWEDADGNNRGVTSVQRGYNEVFTAQYKPITYTIHLNPGIGGSTETEYVDVPYNSVVPRLTADGTYKLPVKEGYNFLGYFDANGNEIIGSDGYYKVGGSTTYRVAGDTSVTARWQAATYDVTFDVDGGSNVNATNTMQFIFDNDYTTAHASSTKTGYEFGGFKRGASVIFDADGNYAVVGGKWKIAQDVTVKAQWNPKQYTVELENGQQFDGTNIPDTTITVSFDQQSPSIPQGKLGAKNGATLTGYYTTPETGGYKVFNGDGTFANHNDVTKWNIDDDNLTLYARYEAESYDLTVNYNDGTTPNRVTNYHYGDIVTVEANPTREGYNFTGWTDETGATFTFTQNMAYHWTTAKTVTAGWDGKTYNYIVHNPDGNENHAVKFGTLPTHLAGTLIKDKTGHQLAGYYTLPNGQGDIVYDSHGAYQQGTALYTKAGNTDIYPYYTANPVTVTFTVDNVNTVVDSSYGSVLTSDQIPSTPNVEVDTQYHSKFDGWQINGAGAYVTPQAMTLTADVTFVAHFHDEKHNMVEVPNAGTDSTCTVPGTIVKKCSECTHQTNDTSRPLAPHHYVEDTAHANVVPGHEPTCHSIGRYYGVCDGCNKVASTQDPNVPYTGSLEFNRVGYYEAHEWTDDVQYRSDAHATKIPTCGDPTGKWFYYCPNCRLYSNQTDAAGVTANTTYDDTVTVNHEFGNAPAGVTPKVVGQMSDYNCTQDVKYYKYCPKCSSFSDVAYGNHANETYTNGTKGAHDFDAYTTAADAHMVAGITRTCQQASVYYDKCTKCGRFADDVEGTSTAYRSNGAKYPQTDTDKAHHSDVYISDAEVPAQVGVAGHTAEYTCRGCGHVWESKPIDALNHTYDPNVDPNDPNNPYIDPNTGDLTDDAKQHIAVPANCSNGAYVYGLCNDGTNANGGWADDLGDPQIIVGPIGPRNATNHKESVSITAQTASCTQDGWDACFYCDSCHKYFTGTQTNATNCGDNKLNFQAKWNHVYQTGAQAGQSALVQQGGQAAINCTTELILDGTYCNICHQYKVHPQHTGRFGPHDYNSYDTTGITPNIPANCKEGGKWLKRCTVHPTEYAPTTFQDPYFTDGVLAPNTHIGGTQYHAMVPAQCIGTGVSGTTAWTECLGCHNPIGTAPQPINPVSHQFTRNQHDGFAATCYADGKKDTVLCTWCDAVQPGSGDVILKTTVAHTPSATRVGAYAKTCDNPGFTGDIICTVCEAHGYHTVIDPGEPIDAGHTWINDTTVPGNCEHGDLVTRHCKFCDAKESTEIGAGTGHNWVTSSLSAPKDRATCEHAARYYKYCTKCGLYANDPSFNGSHVDDPNCYFESGAKGQHKADPNQPGDCMHQAVCQYCGHLFGEVNNSKHTGPFTNKHDGKDATCTEAGWTDTIICDGCGNPSQTKTTIPAHHTDDDGDGMCDDCNEPTKDHKHVDADHDTICDTCHKPTAEHKHVDADNDTICDTCHGAMPNHSHNDSDGDGYCDSCHGWIRVNINQCGCICHLEFDTNNFVAAIGKLLYHFCRFFWRLFRTRRVCECGRWHY